jgi:CheY-like chemotaxis protein
MLDKHPIVLVAEDREDDVLMLKRAFKQLGFGIPVQYVSNGDETIAYLAGSGRFANRDEYPLPDLLLLDLKMPRRSGFEVLQWIQKQPTLSKLRVVVLTTSSDIYEVNRAYQLGAASFLTKPLHFNEFRDTIQAVYNYWVALNRPGSVERPERPPAYNPYQPRPETEE